MLGKLCSYEDAINHLKIQCILCNDVEELGGNLYENLLDLNPDFNTEREIFQWYITDASKFDIEYAKKHFSNLYFTYSDVLNKYILAVDHYGSAWDNVQIDTDLDIHNVD